MKSLARAFFRFAFAPLVWLIYRIRKIGRENIPRHGGVLLLSNHVSYIDSFILYLSCPRPVRFVVLESYTRVKAIAWFLKLFGAIPIRPEKAKEAIVRTVAALDEGDVVCLFPEGGLTRLGVTTEFKKGFELIVRKANCPVVPVYMDGLFESIFSFERGRYFKKRPQSLVCPLQVAFGPAIPADEATAESVRLAVWEQSAIAFSQRREFRTNLEVRTIRSLKRRRRSTLFAEYGRSGTREWSRSQILAVAISIARRWMNHPTERGDRIGILLPPGPMTSALNLGLTLAGKVPVNLPFTIDQHETERIAAGVAPLGIRTVITSRAFMPHLMDFWEGDEGGFIDMKSVVSPTGSLMTLFERIRAVFEPSWMTCWRLDLHRRDPDREAAGLMPEPGDTPVFLTSRDLLRDTRRVYAANFVRQEDSVFTEDSPSRPEGFVFGCWGAILGRGRAVSRSLSLREDGELLERALLEQIVTLLCGSESFFERIGPPLAVRSVKYGFVFGSKSPRSLRDLEKRLDLPLARCWSFQGRIVTMSRTDPNIEDSERHQGQKGRDFESVGRLLPGYSGKIENGALKIRLSPDGPWLNGPEQARISADGMLYLSEA
ncbi:MAG: 1-acyl-sn-glycerol-3-phosphate acyltransferase [Verrucomicrobiae bacterium]|nr:1-acyl-sn-glycerol-3-phosphate acyltransferase [Verrucomicrobiae bacterium]